ncbi:amino acid ABC transporter ATP-binding protein [Pseudomonas syringae]|uniref:amino acid ABC transporter ATP-binding protein n=1 Tax=Pseudomonas syringae TaxID=317 RepID=UPI0011C361B1
MTQTHNPGPGLLSIEGLHKSYGAVEVLKGVDLRMQKGNVVTLIGSSGSGKTTLLRCVNLLEEFQGGHIRLEGQDIGYSNVDGKRTRHPERLIAQHRAMTGMAFQQFNLFPHLSALQNVTLGLLKVKKMPKDQAVALAEKWLDRVGLLERRNHFPGQLSGGQQQRVAIARALTQRAEVILADEPIASLDPESARRVMEILADINRRDGKTVVVTLHQVDYAVRYCPRAVALKSGRIHFDGLAQELSKQFLNDLYGADADASLMITERSRRVRQKASLTLAKV